MTDDTEIRVHRWPVWKAVLFAGTVSLILWAGLVKIAEMIWSVL